jgi:predicted MFS family arabinose efflux permease
MRRVDLRLLLVLILVLVSALALLSWRTVERAEALLLPELNRKAEVVGKSVADLVQQAVGYGMSLDDLVGVDTVLERALARGVEFGFVALTDADGNIMALAERDAGETRAAMPTVKVPITLNGRLLAQVVVGVPQAVARTLVEDLWLDIAVVLLVSVLVTVELLSFAFGLEGGQALRGAARRIEALRRGDLRSHPRVEGRGALVGFVRTYDERVEAITLQQARLRENAEAVNDAEALRELAALERRYRMNETRGELPLRVAAIRTPLFLFFFAEEMTRPFLPGFVSQLARPIAGLSIELVISLPIVLFMAIVALTQPFLGGLTEALGRGRCLRAGSALAVVGFVGTAYAGDMVELLTFRSLTAFGYAAVFVAAQGHIIDLTGAASRARGLAVLVTAIMVASLCGPPIGGILADRLGDRSTFLVAGALGLAALACAYLSLPTERARADRMRPTLGLSAIYHVLRRPALAILMVGCALPAKMLLVGMVFYLVPLELTRAGFEQATIGRILMLYALAMLIVVPFVAKRSDAAGRRPRYVLIGGLLSSCSVVHLLLWPAPWGATLAVLHLGIAQALSITPQSALVGEYGRLLAPQVPESLLYGVFRLVERLGNAIGPAMAAWLLGVYGPQTAGLAIGGLALLGTLSFALLVWARRRHASNGPRATTGAAT